MKRKLALLIIVIGLVLVGYSVYKILKTETAQKNSLEVAQEIVSEPSINKKEDFSPFTGDVAGILSIPKLGAELPIVEGTDEDDLEKGVGHYNGTAWPLGNNQIVLSGHRDTVFRKLGELKIGDELIIKVPFGEFSYKIESTKIVDADDRTVIKSTAPNEILTVTTCYPFSYVGDAPERYIVNAVPVK